MGAGQRGDSIPVLWLSNPTVVSFVFLSHEYVLAAPPTTEKELLI